MGNNDIIDIAGLSAQAEAKNIDDPAAVADCLRGIIARNIDYLKYRAAHGRRGAYNEQVARDNEVLAMAVQLLEQQGNATAHQASLSGAWSTGIIIPESPRVEDRNFKAKVRKARKRNVYDDSDD